MRGSCGPVQAIMPLRTMMWRMAIARLLHRPIHAGGGGSSGPGGGGSCRANPEGFKPPSQRLLTHESLHHDQCSHSPRSSARLLPSLCSPLSALARLLALHTSSHSHPNASQSRRGGAAGRRGLHRPRRRRRLGHVLAVKEASWWMLLGLSSVCDRPAGELSHLKAAKAVPHALKPAHVPLARPLPAAAAS